MSKLKKGVYTPTPGIEKTKAYKEMIAKMRSKAAKMANESDKKQWAAYYAIQEIRKQRALENL